MEELVARRYGAALFEAAEDQELIKGIYEELTSMRTAFEEDDRFLQVLSHPRISKTEKKNLIDSVFKGHVARELLNFLYILVDKKREKHFLEIIKVYEDLYYKHEGILRVVATTAVALKEEAMNRLAEALAKKLNKEILIKNRVDKDVIGGVKLDIEGKLIDGTIKGRLDDMARALQTSLN